MQVISCPASILDYVTDQVRGLTYGSEEYVRRRCKEANVLPLQIGVEGSLMDYPYATCWFE